MCEILDSGIMNNNFIVIAIILVLLCVGFTGCIGDDNDEELAPTATLKLNRGDVLNSSSNQTLVILIHKSGDPIKYSEMKISISNYTYYVGSTFYTLSFDVEQPNLHAIMTKGDNIGDPDFFEVGEVIYFQESGGNWDAVNDLWVKIVHRPSKSTIIIENVDLK